MITSLDHAQLAMPSGLEHEARRFYCGLLGLLELEKPPTLAARGGIWCGLPDGRQLHLGVEDPFAPARKAHIALVVDALDRLADRLAEAERPVHWDDELAHRRRFYSEDPFGNRLEFVEPVQHITGDTR